METPNSRKRIIVVLGMHRSGTSVITRGLSVLGVELGRNLLPAQADNIKGFWEDRTIVEINTALMNRCGQDWQTLGALDLSGQSALMQQALDYVGDVFKELDVWGFKDPRTTRLLPFWNSVFDALDLDPSYCLVVRHPLSVADSLQLRNGFSTLRSSLLWYQYSMDALAGLGSGTFTLVDYDAYLDRPREGVDRIARGLKLKVDIDDEQYKEYCDGYITPALRHSRYDLASLDETAAIAGEVAALYASLLQLQGEDESRMPAGLSDRVTAWQQRQQDCRDLYRLVNELGGCEEHLHTSEQRRQACEIQLHGCQQSLDGCEQRLGIALEHLQQTLKERDSVIAEREIHRERHQMAVASLDRSQAETEAVRKLLEERSRLVDELHHSTSWKMTAPLRSVVARLKAVAGLFSKRV